MNDFNAVQNGRERKGVASQEEEDETRLDSNNICQKIWSSQKYPISRGSHLNTWYEVDDSSTIKPDRFLLLKVDSE